MKPYRAQTRSTHGQTGQTIQIAPLPTPATESWWIGKDRAALRAEYDRQQHRIQGSKQSYTSPLSLDSFSR